MFSEQFTKLLSANKNRRHDKKGSPSSLKILNISTVFNSNNVATKQSTSVTSYISRLSF